MIISQKLALQFPAIQRHVGSVRTGHPRNWLCSFLRSNDTLVPSEQDIPETGFAVSCDPTTRWFRPNRTFCIRLAFICNYARRSRWRLIPWVFGFLCTGGLAYGADANKVDYGGQGQCETNYADVYITINYDNVTPGDPIAIQNTNNVGVHTFTPVGGSGTISRFLKAQYHCPTVGFGSGSSDHYIAGPTTGSTTRYYSASGGRTLTSFMTNGGQGNKPNPCPTTTVNTVEIIYQITGDPIECSWSLDWNFSTSCPGGTAASHVFELLIDGVPHSGSPLTVPPGQTTITGEASDTSAGGTTVVLKVDGTSVASHVVNCPVDGQPPPTANVWVVNATITDPCTASPTPVPTVTPSGTVTPTPAPTPTPPPFPTPKATPPAPPTPGGSPPPPNGSPGTNVTLSNMGDFYNAIKLGVRDSGEGAAIADPSGFGDVGLSQDRGKMDELAGEAASQKSSYEKLFDFATRFKDWVTDFEFDELGQSTSLNFGTVTYGNKTFGPIQFDSSQFPYRNLIRLLLLWMLTVLFFFKAVDIIKGIAE